MVDGAFCGRIREGQELRFEITPGQHWAQARISWTGSPRLDFDVPPGAVVYLYVQPAGSSFEMWQALGRTSYLLLSKI